MACWHESLRASAQLEVPRWGGRGTRAAQQSGAFPHLVERARRDAEITFMRSSVHATRLVAGVCWSCNQSDGNVQAVQPRVHVAQLPSVSLESGCGFSWCNFTSGNQRRRKSAPVSGRGCVKPRRRSPACHVSVATCASLAPRPRERARDAPPAWSVQPAPGRMLTSLARAGAARSV